MCSLVRLPEIGPACRDPNDDHVIATALAVNASRGFRGHVRQTLSFHLRSKPLTNMVPQQSIAGPAAPRLAQAPLRRRLRISRLIATLFSATACPMHSGTLASAYTDPNYQLDIPFGARSHWIQPWRAYLETVPANRFLNGLGVVLSSPDNADLVLEHLARHGIKLTRIEVGWGNLNYEDESLTSPSLRAALQACKKWGIRPIILLNANQGAPCPARYFYRTVTAEAAAGATSVQLDGTTGLVLGRSGLSNLTGYWAAEALITAIDGHTVTLSKPLPKAIPANTRVSMATLKYRPFSPPGTPEGEETLNGWRRYVETVARYAGEALGTADNRGDKGFDLEIWNELTFGSNFLYINAYYRPAPYQYNQDVVWGNLLQATVDCARQAPGAFSGVQVADGFASTIPWPSASNQPVGIGAICKHPYPRDRSFPVDDDGRSSVNAQLQLENRGWVPGYRCRFPEYGGTAIQTEHLIRDMSPLTTRIATDAHGRQARVADGRVVECDTWITETGYDPHGYGVVDAPTALTLKAKATARTLCFYLQKGVKNLTLFSSGAGDLEYGIVQDNFIDYAKSHKAYPDDDSSYTSPALMVTKRIVDLMSQGLDSALMATRPLQVTSISDAHDHRQFDGDGTAAHPPLYDRDVLAILPFEVNAGRFVIPYYVMTRDLTQALAPEVFTISLKGVNAASIRARAYDPLNDRDVPVTVDSASGNAITLTAVAADYPYLLIIDDDGGT